MRTNPLSTPVRGGRAGAAAGSPDGNRGRPSDGRSYVIGDTTIPLRFITVPALLQETVDRFGPAPAVVFREPDLRWTWHDLARKVDDLAAGLLSLGIVGGDRVGIWAPNRPEWLLTQLATARIGAILVNINPAYRISELEHALNTVRAKALVLADRSRSSDYLAMLGRLAPELADAAPGRLSARRLPHLRLVVRMGSQPSAGMLRFDEVTALGGPAHRARLPALAAALDPDDAINVQFTSGTTGSPKGATLSHHNIVNNARFVAAAMVLSADDRLCIPVPLYHCFGMVLGVLACVASGATMVFPGESFDPVATMKAVSEARCTAPHGLPKMFIAQLDHPDVDGYDFGALRTGIMAGAPCPVETMKRVVGRMNLHQVTIAYGMTETSPVSFQSAVDDPLERRVSTVGRVQPHLEVKIVDETGRIVPVGRTGELCTRGYAVMKGYWDDPAATRAAIRDGWMHTGDLATIDADGYCNIVGRAKDMIIRGGENVFPREVEEFLYRHPKVQDVQVFGVPDPRLGEEVACWIVLKSGQRATEAEIRTFCEGEIARYKVPRYVRFVGELPMTVTGKPQKFLMREAMRKELGLPEQRTA